jgi:HEAT repeat protein
MGEAAVRPEVLQALTERLRDEDGDVRRAAAEALGRMGEAAATPEVLQALTERLRDVRWDVHYAATRALGTMGPAAATPEVLQALTEHLQDEVWEVSSAPGYVRPWGMRQLIDEYSGGPAEVLQKDVRRSVVWALGRMGPAAATPEVLQALLEYLRHEDGRVREAAAKALGAMGEAAARPEVLQALTERLRDKDGDVREAAAEALTAWHRQGLRFFRDAQGRWTVRTVEELSAPSETT